MKVERRSQYVIAGTAYSREEVIHRYIHFVKYVAGRISVNLPPNVELNDLISDGVIGLIDAVEKYDDDRGVKFETYAITRIHGAILDALRALDWVPRAVRQKARELDRVSQEMETEFGHAPSDEEIAQRMGLTPKEFDTLQQRVRGTSILSLEEHLPNEKGNDVPLLDSLRGDDGEVGGALEQREVRESLVAAVAALSY
ncbi:MAG: sigma-70 family RNA polymerase sigma factor, partial [Candidatus Eremiobacteraeota bacterium]|nr:sigma-70 family RNA polymerase sigma factor [Candidatus Eremiobacteraeota bacterium]